MKFGAAIWPFRWDPPYDEQVKRIASMGFKALELIVWNQASFDYYTAEKVKELRELIASEGLEVSQFVHTPPGMSSPDESTRKRGIEGFKHAVDLGVSLGASLINSVSASPFDIDAPKITDRPHMQMFPVPYPSGLDWSRNWESYVDSVRRCTGIVEAAGLRYSIEPHPFRLVANAASMLRLIEQVDSPALGMNFDPSHLFPVGEIPHAVIYQLGAKVFHCHFSDNDGTTNVHWRPGKGKIDWSAVIRALSDVGFEGVISIELEDVPGVARGASPEPGVYQGNATATDEFAAETTAAVEYIRRQAAAQNVNIEWSGKEPKDAVYA